MTRDEHLQRVIDIAEGRWSSASELGYSGDEDYFQFHQTVAIRNAAETQIHLAAAQAMDMRAKGVMVI